MNKLNGLQPERVFAYFEELSAIPRGSGNMQAISSYCVDFADKYGLHCVRDEADNVIIYKNGTSGYENSEPIILQGHLDMVCQKTPESTIDFEKDGLELMIDGDFVTANGTTLGADNGIAVAMVLAILESTDIPHPPIEAVFTTDEEIGMIGALKLDMTKLKGKKMINLDAEEIDTLTVSCAGGSEIRLTAEVERTTKAGKVVEVVLKGLKGGHSGVEINSGRVNADILAGRVLNCAKQICDFDLVSVDGGDKSNAIPLYCVIRLMVQDITSFVSELSKCLDTIKTEISDREPNFGYTIDVCDGEAEIMDDTAKRKLMSLLISAPNGVMEMSCSIDNLVETSLNLGILETESDKISATFSLRSNKQSALEFMEEKMTAIAEYTGFLTEAYGHYPPWEFNNNSTLQKMYIESCEKNLGFTPEVAAIHAGLECGVFASQIDGFDGIAVGPQLADVHTTNETLQISSVQKIYDVLLDLLKNCK